MTALGCSLAVAPPSHLHHRPSWHLGSLHGGTQAPCGCAQDGHNAAGTALIILLRCICRAVSTCSQKTHPPECNHCEYVDDPQMPSAICLGMVCSKSKRPGSIDCVEESCCLVLLLPVAVPGQMLQHSVGQQALLVFIKVCHIGPLPRILAAGAVGITAKISHHHNLPAR